MVGVELAEVVVEVLDYLEEVRGLEGFEESGCFGGFAGAEGEVKFGVVFGGFICERGGNWGYFECVWREVGERREAFAEVLGEGGLIVENEEWCIHAELGGEGEEVGLADIEFEDLVEGFEDGGFVGGGTAKAGAIGNVFDYPDLEFLADLIMPF